MKSKTSRTFNQQWDGIYKLTGIDKNRVIRVNRFIKKLEAEGLVKFNSKYRVYKGTFMPRLVNVDYTDIIKYYSMLIQGIINYNRLTISRSALRYVKYVLETSCALTLTRKYKLKRIARAYKKFGKDLALFKANLSTSRAKK